MWFLQDRFEEAVPVAEEGIAAVREKGGFHQADWLTGLGNIYRFLGDHEKARPLLRESLELFTEAGDDHEAAVRLAGTTSAIKERVGGGAPAEPMRYGRPEGGCAGGAGPRGGRAHLVRGPVHGSAGSRGVGA